MRLTSIHPFPARMAPELALKTIANLGPEAIVLDPMCGSGTVLRAAVESGNQCIGFDLDPLAVLMSRVWTSPLTVGLVKEAQRIAHLAASVAAEVPFWQDEETRKFAEFWFEEKQRIRLSALARILLDYEGPHKDALQLAMSRLIITKERGASIARDTSHSRPHRVFYKNDFDVLTALPIAAKRIEDRLNPGAIGAKAAVERSDGRKMPIASASVDAVITSPPYLNAIDYMRGHRLALIWLGHTLQDLRKIRSSSIGAEAATPTDPELVLPAYEITGTLAGAKAKIVERYRSDIQRLMKELRRVVKPGGTVVVVVGNSNIAGVPIANAAINQASAESVGFVLSNSFERDLPTQSRYLPTPASSQSSLGRRMRTETVLSFAA